MRNPTKWLVRTGVSLALLLVVQVVTKALGQLVTGSCVNLILAVTAGVLGLGSGAVLAVISPFLAFLLGIGPKFLLLVPGIAAGNLIYVVIICLIAAILRARFPKSGFFIAAVAGAACKFLTLWVIIVKTVLPGLLAAGTLTAAQSNVLAASFSFLQLFTALLGGLAAGLMVPLLRKAIPPLHSKRKNDTPEDPEIE